VTELESRLARCFAAVFPELDVAQLASASPETLSDWDSLHTLTLIAVVEEQFGLTVPAADYPSLRSYAAARDYLGRAVD
jgi:acyl carrier protein